MIDLSLLPFALPPFITGSILLFLGILSFVKRPSVKANFYFFLLMLACATWLMGFGAMNVMKRQPDAFLCSRILYSGVILIPAFYYHFIISFLGLKFDRHMKYVYAASCFFLVSLWTTGTFLEGNNYYFWDLILLYYLK